MLEFLDTYCEVITFLIFAFSGFYCYVGTKVVSIWIRDLPFNCYSEGAITVLILFWPWYAYKGYDFIVKRYTGGDKKKVKECLTFLKESDEILPTFVMRAVVEQEDIEPNTMCQKGRKGLWFWE